MVEWKTLDNCLRFEQPTPYLVQSTEYDDSYKTPVLTAGQSLLLGYTNETDGIFKASKENPCIIFDDFTTSFHWIDFDFKVKSSAMKMLRPQKNVNFRYVYYAMLGINFVPGGHQRHWISKYSQFEIPIPSQEEQQRIVGILDTFTASIDNLKEQIAHRRKQYEYYRDQLLDLEGKPGVEMKTLGDICEISRGVRVVKRDLEESGIIPVFQNSLLPLGYYARSNNNGNTFVIIGGAAGDIGYSEKPFWAADDCLCISGKEVLVDKFIYNFLIRDQHYLKSQVRKAGVPRLSRGVLDKLCIPVPSLQEQSRIVGILDTFEASIQNLEAQLKEREKQYEYYRNKLLTFE